MSETGLSDERICDECGLPWHTHPSRLCDEFVSPKPQEERSEPEVRRYTVDICTPCINLEGQECHTPGCIFFLCGMQEVREYLTRTLIRPTIDGELLPALQEGVPTLEVSDGTEN